MYVVQQYNSAFDVRVLIAYCNICCHSVKSNCVMNVKLILKPSFAVERVNFVLFCTKAHMCLCVWLLYGSLAQISESKMQFLPRHFVGWTSWWLGWRENKQRLYDLLCRHFLNPCPASPAWSTIYKHNHRQYRWQDWLSVVWSCCTYLTSTFVKFGVSDRV